VRTLLRGGRLAVNDRLESWDLLLEDGRIAAMGPALEATPDCVVDASGAYVLPGFIDIHTHLDDRIGHFELADDYERGSRVAVLNGITTIGSFVTQGPEESLRAAMQRARAKASGRLHADLAWHLTPTSFTEADFAFLETLPRAGYHTIKLYSTYREAGIFADYDRMASLFRRLGPHGFRFLVHGEDDALLSAVDLSALDLTLASSHGRMRSVATEVTAINTLAALAAETGASIHVVHVSSTAGAAAVAQGRVIADLSCETCPQYLWLSDDHLAQPDGHRWLCCPPLRQDPSGLRAFARTGAFEVLATDHCAFRKQDKDAWNHRDIRTVASGLPGLGALPHLAWKIWEGDPDVAALAMARHLSREPARVMGFSHRKGALVPGLDADVVVLDASGVQRPIQASLSDVYDPYSGFTSPLAFRHVLRRGEVVVAHDNLCSPERPSGQLLQGEP